MSVLCVSALKTDLWTGLERMLSPEIIQKIKRIHIKSGRMVDTMMAGSYRSVFRGTGIEFEEVREYAIGDDVKTIDWNVSARMGRPFVKRYREERELVLMLLVDVSASMGFGTTAVRKTDLAAETSAILAFNAIRNNDRVGAILFTDRVEKYIPPKKGASHIWRVIREIFTYTPEHRGTDMQAALSYLGRIYPGRTVAFLISDFLSRDCSRGLRTVSRKHDLVSVFVTDRGDRALPAGGLVRVMDMETGGRKVIDASNKSVRKACEHRMAEQQAAVYAMLKTGDVDCIQIHADRAAEQETHAADALARYFQMRSKRMR
ncbi:MAG: DUF58 domain-containing protein [Thermodesulfobacteriota bacterium]|nr:DUF58 domain-containing protein [Thermodesulfobacteriota bacterium]